MWWCPGARSCSSSLPRTTLYRRKARLSWMETRSDLISKTSFATLDFGRGVWPYQGFWNWASFSTRLSDGRTLGVNFGAGWTDNTGSTENALCMDGRLIKLSEDVIFTYSTQNFKAPWRIQTAETKRVDLTFTPFLNVSPKPIWRSSAQRSIK